ncbi:MAG: ABC transporter ATP-binding protein [Desulfamplus sp.]
MDNYNQTDDQNQINCDGHISPLISLRGISRVFKSSAKESSADIEILKDVDFDIYKGETIAVVGASGTGKSTFLHIVGTLDRPNQGRLIFENRNLFSLGQEELAHFRNLKIGFVFQFHHLLQGFTAIENVMIPGLIANLSKKKIVVESEAILERVGLKHRIHHRVEDLSGGEQQRVALARALVMKPDILLADEPTGNLDKINSFQVHHLLVELNKELGMTLMVVTHNNELAALMSRQVTIQDCKIVDVG